MQTRISVTKMLETGTNLSGRKLTDRQRQALINRQPKTAKMGGPKPCIGCYSGIVPWNQGSEYCSRCLKNS